LAIFRKDGRSVGLNYPQPAANGVFFRHVGQYGYVPTRPGRRIGLGSTPALDGLFRAGRVVGVSQINALATNIFRGP
jgi:hypothetical protein